MLNNDKKENCKNFRPLSFHKLCVHMHVNAEDEIWKKPMALEYFHMTCIRKTKLTS